MQAIFKTFLHTSIFAACCALSLCMAAEHFLTGHIPPLFSALHALVFAATLVEYNIHHLFNHKRIFGLPEWGNNDDKLHMIILIIGIILGLASLPFLSWNVLMLCTVLGIIALAYSTPVLPFKYKKRLKDFGLLKIFTLTIIWVLITTVLPAVYLDIYKKEVLFSCAMRFLLIFPLCIAFDIRDVEVDAAKEIHTLPVTVGIAQAYRIIDLSLILMILIAIILRLFYEAHYPSLIAVIGSALAAKWAINASRKPKNSATFLFYIDGIMLLYGVLSMAFYLVC